MTFSTLLSVVRKHTLLVVSGILLVVGGGFYFMRSGEVEYLSVSYDDMMLERARILKNLKFGADIDPDVEVSNQQLANAEHRMLDSRDLASNYNYFFQIENATGVELQDLKQLEYAVVDSKGRRRKSRTNFERIRFQMTISGRLPEVLNFVRGLEGGSAFYQLENMRVVKNKSEGSVSIGLSLLMLGTKGAA